MNGDEPKACLDTALRILARRDHSCRELTLKLSRRGYGNSAVGAALAECRRLGYVDDDRFARLLIRHLRRKGFGILRIKQALSQKGVAADTIHAAITEKCSEPDQLRDCRRALEKKLSRSMDAVDSAKADQRLFRFLSQRGFLPGVIRQAFDERHRGVD